jgi:nucleoside-diphosphate-sugar epimerase
MSLAGLTALVTGGAGFLGATLAARLAALGARVRVLDAMLPETGANAFNLAGVPHDFIRADLRHDDLAGAAAGVDLVFDLAAQTSHMGSQHDPRGDLAHNADARLRLILALREGSPRARAVYASTRQLYGRPRYQPVDENHPIDPPDANAVSKWAGEQYWLLEHKVHGRHATALRLTNCFGPRLRVKDARQTFIGIWIRRTVEGEPFEVWGGGQRRDFLHADDVADAMILAATTDACAGRAFNLGGTPPVTLLRLAELMGGPYLVREMPTDRAKIDVGSVTLDDSAFRAATGWQPRVALSNGLAATLAYYRENLPRYLQDAP